MQTARGTKEIIPRFFGYYVRKQVLPPTRAEKLQNHAAVSEFGQIKAERWVEEGRRGRKDGGGKEGKFCA